MEECSRNFWIGEWQTEQLLPLFIAKTGCIESEITPVLINIYIVDCGRYGAMRTIYSWNIVRKYTWFTFITQLELVKAIQII